MTSLAKLRRELLTDPEVKAEYDRLADAFPGLGAKALDMARAASEISEVTPNGQAGKKD